MHVKYNFMVDRKGECAGKCLIANTNQIIAQLFYGVRRLPRLYSLRVV